MDALTAAIRTALSVPDVADALRGRPGLQDQLANVLEKNIRHQCGGTFYLARRASREQVQERNARMREQFNGNNLQEVARAFGLNPRTARRYVTGK